MKRQSLRLVTIVILASAVARCSSSNPPSAPDAQTPPALPPLTVDASSACMQMGPEGGTLVHGAGAQLVVPAGALDTSTKLCLTGAAPAATDVLGGVALAQSVVASPAGQTFHKPVDIVLPFDPTRMESGTSIENVQLRMAPDGSSAFESLQSTIDLAARVVRARTVHFTQFVPVLNPNPVFITTPTSLPDGTTGAAYTAQTFAAAGGTLPYQWTIAPGSTLPSGLALSNAGILGGTPTRAGNYGLFVMVSDSASHSVQEAFALTVSAPNNATPTLTQISPTTMPQGSSTTTILLAGTAFAPTIEARWDGVSLSTTFVSATQASAAIPTANLATAGTHQVTVWNPAPGGGASGALPFVVTAVASNPVPSIASVSPAQLPVSNVDTLVTVTGGSFVASSSVVVAGQKLATTFVSTSQLTATVPASMVNAPGMLVFGVFNPAPGGGASSTTVSVPVGAVSAAPVLSQVSPDTIPQFATSTLTLIGTGFTASSAGLWDGAFVATTFVSATQLTVMISGATQTTGTHQVSVSNPAPGGGTSAPLTVTVASVVPNPAPTVTAVSPSALVLSNVDTQITITGTGFVPSTSAVIGNQGISTSFISSTQIGATVPASYLASVGTLQIGAYNPAPGGGFSATTAVLVQVPNPVPAITSLLPSSNAQGGPAFNLTVTGTSFAQGAQIFFGNTALSTTVQGPTSAVAQVPASLIVSPGMVQVVVVNSSPGGGTSGSLPFTIRSTPTFPGAWSIVTPTGAPPPARKEMHAMAALGNGLVVFGDQSMAPNSVYANETWTFNGTAWTKNTPATPPSAREYHVLATFGNRVVLFGGTDSAHPLNDTWQWDGAQWTQMTPAHSPPARLQAAMAAVGNKLVLYGGSPIGTSDSLNDTWEWDGTDWTQRTPATDPGPRRAHAFTSLGGKAVLFGGESGGKLTGDTWEWDGTSWTQVATTGPLPRWEAALTRLGAGLVLYGGAGNTDTWRWDGTAWSEVAPANTYQANVTTMSSATLGNAAYLFGNNTTLFKAVETCTQAIDCASGVCWSGVCCPNACTSGQSCASGICN